MKALRKAIGLLALGTLCLMPSTVKAQATAINLAWDYLVTDEAGIDQFVLQRRTGSGAYSDLQTVVKTARITSDTTVVQNTLYCYQIYATRTFGTMPIRSAASNEVCGASIKAVVNLRLQ